jgi:excisionase family DNA binding protein
MANPVFFLVPEEVITRLEKTQLEIMEILNKKTKTSLDIKSHLTAKEFMSAVSISRSKFDQLIDDNAIKSVKKGRKIYVPVTEVERYFTQLEHSSK